MGRIPLLGRAEEVELTKIIRGGNAELKRRVLGSPVATRAVRDWHELLDAGEIEVEELMPRGLKNVMVAGRCLSATREGMGTARTMGPCMAMGEAAGTAAALCAERGIVQPRELPVRDLQKRLKENGAVIDGVY